MTVIHELPTTLHVGLDVAKLTLQVDLAGRDLALANTPAGHRSLLAHLRRWQAKTGQPTHVVREGTGGYERAVVRALQAAGEPVSVQLGDRGWNSDERTGGEEETHEDEQEKAVVEEEQLPELPCGHRRERKARVIELQQHPR